jgi:hypothetical protein
MRFPPAENSDYDYDYDEDKDKDEDEDEDRFRPSRPINSHLSFDIR